MREQFDQLYKADPRLINGDYYKTPIMSEATGHPFYFDANWKQGSVLINGRQFSGLPLRFDIKSNELVLSTIDFTNSYLQLALSKEQIESFTLGGHLFMQLPAPKGIDAPAVFEVLVDLNIKLLQYQRKSLKVTPGGSTDYMYQTLFRRYLYVNQKLIRYQGRRTLFSLYPDHKAQLKRYIRQEKLKLWSLKSADHMQLVEHCNKLQNQT